MDEFLEAFSPGGITGGGQVKLNVSMVSLRLAFMWLAMAEECDDYYLVTRVSPIASPSPSVPSLHKTWSLRVF